MNSLFFPDIKVQDEKLYLLFGAFVIAVLLVALLTPVSMKLAQKWNIVDLPDKERHLHKKATPVLGGLAIYIAFIVTFFIVVLYRHHVHSEVISDILNPRVQGLLVGSTIIMIVGLIDDRFDMNAKVKLLFQILAACVLVLPWFNVCFTVVGGHDLNALWYIGNFAVPLGSIATVFWVVLICNTINLMDGLDGLAAGIVAIAAITFVLISIFLIGSIGMAILASILAGVTVGFLFYNFNPAKTFMGDSGALFLGYIIATLSVLQNWKMATIVALGMPILVLSVPICDITFAVIRRLLNGKSPFAADRGHLHHRLLDSGLSQKRTVLIIYGLTIAGCIIALTLFRGQ